MKAKEYYEKYKDAAIYFKVGPESKLIDLARSMLNDLIDESVNMCKSRNISKATGIASVVKEFNQKWNAINRIFVEKHNFTPFKDDAFKTLILDRVPELKGLI